MSQYRVDLDIFAGPLDLLLHLVRKDEVEIYDIPIARVTEQYIEYIEMLKMFDIDLAGDFLVMAATLMEIKSAMLLPSVDAEDLEQGEVIDPRSELVRQLLEYKKIKDAANLLADSADQRKDRFTRPDSIIANLKKSDEPELDLDQVSVWTLLEAFDSIMQATGRVSSYDHITDDTPIDLYQIEILHRLQTEGAMSFADIFKARENRLVMVGLFLAMLELIRYHLIWVEQSAPTEPIMVSSLTQTPAQQAVHNIIYADNLQDETEQTPEVETEQTQTADTEQPEPQQPTQPKAQIPIKEIPPVTKTAQPDIAQLNTNTENQKTND